MKNKVPSCVINVIHYNKVRRAILCNAAKIVPMEIVILYCNKNFYWFIIFIMKQATLYILLK